MPKQNPANAGPQKLFQGQLKMGGTRSGLVEDLSISSPNHSLKLYLWLDIRPCVLCNERPDTSAYNKSPLCTSHIAWKAEKPCCNSRIVPVATNLPFSHVRSLPPLIDPPLSSSPISTPAVRPSWHAPRPMRSLPEGGRSLRVVLLAFPVEFRNFPEDHRMSPVKTAELPSHSIR